ncbi:hypothetical protein F511_20605 [Dorcoceras hygrometricum]|uniref:Uncharacterized protein n=1 Tax=Dorcoceras hygrometricum TaxID=472368 RepID=A0A2Z7A576_9LAMI|nr:hypothetical protein F511_20605 [Dorcoceras hygrometricum]
MRSVVANPGPGSNPRPELNLEEKFSRRNDLLESTSDDGRTAAGAAITLPAPSATGRATKLRDGRASSRDAWPTAAPIAAHSHALLFDHRATISARPGDIGRASCAAARAIARGSTCVTLNGSGIQLGVGPQPLRLRNYNFGLAQRIMVKRLATSRHDPLGITDSACKNQLVMVSVQYGPFNPYIAIRSTTIGKSRVARDPIAMHTSWRSNSDIASVTRCCVEENGPDAKKMHRRSLQRIETEEKKRFKQLRRSNISSGKQRIVKNCCKGNGSDVALTRCINQLQRKEEFEAAVVLSKSYQLAV